MTAADALRFLEHEAQCCRDRDMHEALCLLLPALVRVLGLPKMDPFEAMEFRAELKEEVTGLRHEQPIGV